VNIPSLYIKRDSVEFYNCGYGGKRELARPLDPLEADVGYKDTTRIWLTS
jgi:hypothetical protein